MLCEHFNHIICRFWINHLLLCLVLHFTHAGEYLALTGEKLNGHEMMACGLATHYYPSEVGLEFLHDCFSLCRFLAQGFYFHFIVDCSDFFSFPIYINRNLIGLITDLIHWLLMIRLSLKPPLSNMVILFSQIRRVLSEGILFYFPSIISDSCIVVLH